MAIQKNRVTLKDIAEETELSINTVSRVLRGMYATPGVTQRVFDAAERLGYIGNSAASSMRSGTTRTIAIIMEDISNPHYSRLLKIMSNFLGRQGYTSIIFNTENSLEYEKNALLSALRRGVDGILICPDDSDPANVNFLKEQTVPFVVFNRGDRDPGVSTVKLDNVKGGRLAARHLLCKGCRGIIFVNGPQDSNSGRERMEGIRQAFETEGIAFDESRTLYAPGLFGSMTRDESGWAEIAGTIMADPLFDGLIAFSDQVALKVLHDLRALGFSRIPIDKLPVVGFDNTMDTFPLPLPISSVGFACEDIGIEAPKLLLEMIEGGERFPKKIVLDVKLCERD